jgi:hypothetical protein
MRLLNQKANLFLLCRTSHFVSMKLKLNSPHFQRPASVPKRQTVRSNLGLQQHWTSPASGQYSARIGFKPGAVTCCHLLVIPTEQTSRSATATSFDIWLIYYLLVIESFCVVQYFNMVPSYDGMTEYQSLNHSPPPPQVLATSHTKQTARQSHKRNVTQSQTKHVRVCVCVCMYVGS